MISLSTPSSDHLHKHSNHTKIPIISPLQSAKVILKAKQSYKSSHKDELSFSSGDQFYLIKPSQNPDLVLVENPSARIQGLVPVKFFEMLIHKDQPGIASPLSAPTSADAPLNVAARVKYDIYQMSEKDLPAKAGDMILLLSDHGDHYMAKLINKLGNPGRVLKSMVEIIDSASASAKGLPIALTKQKSSSYIDSVAAEQNQRGNYKKYHSEADITKPRSRHSPSTASNSSISTTSTVSSASSTATLIAGNESNLQIQSIKPSKAIPHRNQYYLVEYKVYLNDSTKKIIYRKLNQILDIHKELSSMLNMDLPSLPLNINNFHPVKGPFLEDSDLKAIYQYFKQIAALLPNSGVFTLPPILEFAKLTDSSVKQINIEHPTPHSVSQKSSSQSPYSTAHNDDDELIIPPPPSIPLPEVNHYSQKAFTHSIKVKYQYKADLMAMILEPHEINYLTLLTKLTQRTKADIMAIHYQCASSGTLKELRNQVDLVEAIESSGNSKIFLIVS
ncbi:hypothetical protein CONCODRAFT_15209 [Conidiobolus coronatus NRRL 28638]|uniref:SH3 domain-containing protein n=1 Tax=Conidiobolus coronatus (strain ATCC 28846 / CBS 209.66 / NRRL 28638) TaxID=796925 RepID=A0A137PFW2_CONC2|nr:hypothetical protein CONCODRAFT_15209 [Conidiobolus coronatus NRRL 28638]|eukprot:KXN73865.1 hypothetical protein CONCODRAFT_15209 [Conidiobolus coronatus NRRL 28638]